MQRILITGGTGSLGSIVVPRLKQDTNASSDVYRPEKPQPFDWQRMFYLDWDALGTRIHFRPLLAPLAGSYPTSRTWHDQRSLSAERRKSPE